eukprot:COSAG01_NODE_903_length_12848_cov_7.966899_6_plen_109_part_00
MHRVLIDGGYRNGISVIAVAGLVVDSSVVRNTRGTDPEAGLDVYASQIIGTSDRLCSVFSPLVLWISQKRSFAGSLIHVCLANADVSHHAPILRYSDNIISLYYMNLH